MERGAQTILKPGDTVGILGGGQLARMLSVAASRLGLNAHIYSPTSDCPAASVSERLSVGAYDDAKSVLAFAKTCDAVTYEFENVPAVTAKAAASVAPLRPGARALDVSQDRLVEKSFLRAQVGVDVAGFEDITSVHDLRRAVKRLGLPAVLKTRRFGYDGKGQVIIKTESEVDQAWEVVAPLPCILEAFVPFEREVSVVAARGLDGQVAAYPLTENVHRNHILHTSSAPASNDNGTAQSIAARILDHLDYVGVMGVEFFQMADGALIVNEIAPRVHNSGHWTQNAGCTDQFEQHIRAVAGWPLGEVTPKQGVVMTNLIGTDVETWQTLAAEPGTHIHLYGKREIRADRKMGHVNRII
ncbi:5-(carboxyamino)imidazole ribonucleotide synthase [Litorimonas sp. WD9-15]|uniref:5-(carboxyamino)imidazole ribonucleotide synthase n=1 Tax=Litorimonas sp. WD9-15 TaxID=3418716 RepID=UPI003D01D516